MQVLWAEVFLHPKHDRVLVSAPSGRSEQRKTFPYIVKDYGRGGVSPGENATPFFEHLNAQNLIVVVHEIHILTSG